MKIPARIAWLAACCAGLLALILLLNRVGTAETGTAGTAGGPPDRRAATADPPDARAERAQLLARLRSALDRLLASADARPGEALVTFTSPEALQRFLQRAAGAGFEVLGRIDRLNAVRVRLQSQDALAADLGAHSGDYGEIAANALFHVPGIPATEARTAALQVPFGATALAFLGVGDNSGWGRGVTIAIIDSGVADDPAFAGRLRVLDLGLGTSPGRADNDGHGTAVAALAAGAAFDALGVAPGATLLSIRVTGADGFSDTFTVAQAIMAATDAGAQVINISLGAYSGSALLTYAIDYATARGAVITAAAGNNQAAQLTWPAADPRVISVGAVDALEQQVLFSNSGATLKITAPGYGVETAWFDGQRVLLSGTSASAPLVAGAVAAVMTANAGYTAAQAWQVLQTHSNDAGAPGADPAFGNGVLNVGWSMNRNEPALIDTAVSSLFHDPANNLVLVTVQNRGGQGVAGAQLDVAAGTGIVSRALPWLPAGGSTVVSVPAATAAENAPVDYRAVLTNPAGLVDQNPANNRRSATLRPAPPGG